MLLYYYYSILAVLLYLFTYATKCNTHISCRYHFHISHYIAYSQNKTQVLIVNLCSCKWMFIDCVEKGILCVQWKDILTVCIQYVV